MQGPSEHFGRASFKVELSFSSEQDCQINSQLSNMTVSVPRGASALNALEIVANLNSSYRFIVNYKRRFGYVIESLAGAKTTSACKWVLFTTPHRLSQPVPYTRSGVNFFQIPVDGTQIAFRYVPQTKYPS